jgi:hypothetical protein
MDKQASNEYVATTANGFVSGGGGRGPIAGRRIPGHACAPASRYPGWESAALGSAGSPCGFWRALYTLNPNQAAVLKLFGSYRGTDRNEGLRWSEPVF